MNPFNARTNLKKRYPASHVINPPIVKISAVGNAYEPEAIARLYASSVKHRGLVTAIAVLIGGVLLAWQVRRVGVDDIVSGMAAVGWIGSAGILVVSLLRFGARATGWSALIPAEIPPGRAVAATIAGEAAGVLTPLSFVVSEPTKAAYLARAVPGGSLTTASALAALAAETFVFGVSVAVWIIAGAIALLYAYPVNADMRTAGLFALGTMSAVLVVAALVAWRQPTLVGAIVSRVPIPSVRAFADHVREFEESAYGSTRHATARMWVVVLATVAFHLLSFLEIWLTIWLITGQSFPAAAFILDTVGRLTNVLFKMIPLQLGVLQVGSELVGLAIGLPPGTGVTVALIRTIRILFWAGVGVVLLGQRAKGPLP